MIYGVKNGQMKMIKKNQSKNKQKRKVKLN